MKKALQLTLTLFLCFLFVETYGQPFFDITTSVTGGTATVSTVPVTEAEESAIITVTIADIEVGKQFLSIEVEAVDLSIISTNLITVGEEYTFEMPAQAVSVNIVLEDIPAVTYAIATSVTGGTATVTTAPLTEAEESAIVTVTIADIEVGKQFLSIEVEAADLSVISTTLITAGEEYTFEMPAQAVSANIVLEDIEPIIINTQPQSEIICDYDFTTLSVDAVPNNGETLTYQWYYNSEIIDGETTNTLVVDDAGEYYCHLVAGTDELDTDITTITIAEVNPVLEAEVSACDGTTVELDPGVFTSYEWQDAFDEEVYEVTTDGTYSVSVTDDNGCTAMAESEVVFFEEIVIAFEDTVYLCGESLVLEAPESDTYEWGEGEDTQEIEITEEGWYYLTVTTATCTGNDSTYVQAVDLPEEFDLGEDIFACDLSITIDAPEIEDVDFEWTTMETSASIEVTLDGTYGLTLINEYGCERYDELIVEFGDELIVQLNPSDTIHSCDGLIVVLDPEVGTTWIWSTHETNSSIEVTEQDWYNVTVTNEYGCENDDSVYINFHAVPSIDLGNDKEFCADTETTLHAPSAYSWAWSTEELTQDIIVDTSGLYSCTITDGNGCQNTDSLEVTVFALPNVDLGDDVTVFNNVNFVLGVDAGEVEYEWSTGETTSHIVRDASTIPLGSYTYSVTVTNIHGCVDSDDIVVTITEGSAVGQNLTESINITPNPTNGIFKVSGSNIDLVRVYDNIGKLILTSKLNSIDISKYPAGMYFVKITAEDQIKTLKLIKQ